MSTLPSNQPKPRQTPSVSETYRLLRLDLDDFQRGQLSAFLQSETGQKVMTRLLFNVPQPSSGNDAQFLAGRVSGWLDAADYLTFLATPASHSGAVDEIDAPTIASKWGDLENEDAWSEDDPTKPATE